MNSHAPSEPDHHPAGSHSHQLNPLDVMGLHAVDPKKDCPHCEVAENITPLETIIASGRRVVDPCLQCGIAGEVWLCLTCSEVHCSRYVQGHMSHHNAESGHPIVFSFADFSYWCYICDSYIIHERLNHHKSSLENGFYQQKFGAAGSDGHAVLETIKESKYQEVIPEEPDE